MGSLVNDLTRPGVELIETHTSWVFLGKDTVWKLKKPVNLGFLDFTSPEKRRVACEAEVRLNTRLARDVYRGVVPITLDPSGRHRIEGPGDAVDWAVEVVRLPDETRADLLLERGKLSTGAVESLAEHIAAFHAAMPTSREIEEFGRPDAILANVRENFAQTRETIRAHLSSREAAEIEEKQIDFVMKRRDLLESRVLSGRIRDGHGDLRLEHVYLRPGLPPTIIDCIEFNERFRYADVCADVAFLSMDLERLGRADLSERLLAAYARASGDYELYLVVDFYEGYRAYVRGKVMAILAADTGAGFEARERARKEARRAYLLALLSERETLLRPAVITVGGIIASGKSTVAARVSEMVGAPVVEADRTRKALLGVEATTPVHHAAWTGAYSPEFTTQVYEEMLRRAGYVLSSGRPVVLDASFRSREARAAARRLAEQHGVKFFFVECKAELSECRRRLEERARSKSVSDGRLAVFDDFVARWEPVTELPPDEHLVIDTTRKLEANARYLESKLPSWPPGLTC